MCHLALLGGSCYDVGRERDVLTSKHVTPRCVGKPATRYGSELLGPALRVVSHPPITNRVRKPPSSPACQDGSGRRLDVALLGNTRRHTSYLILWTLVASDRRRHHNFIPNSTSFRNSAHQATESVLLPNTCASPTSQASVE